MRQRLHAERVALDDAGHDRREPVVVIFGRAHDGAHLRHVEIFELAPERVHHQFRRQRLHELIGAAQQRLPQLDRPIDRLAARQHGRGVDLLLGDAVEFAPLAGRRKRLERQAVRVDDAVAGLARCVLAVLLEPCAYRLRLLAGRRREIRFDVRRRRRGRRAHELVEHPGAAQHRRRAVAVRGAQQHCAFAEQAAARVVLDGHAAELRAVHRPHAVVAREPLVDERVVGCQQLVHVTVLEQDARDEELDLLREVVAQLVAELGEQPLVGHDGLELVDVEPTQRESRDERLRARIGQHALDLAAIRRPDRRARPRPRASGAPRRGRGSR